MPWLTLSGSNYLCLERFPWSQRCSSHWDYFMAWNTDIKSAIFVIVWESCPLREPLDVVNKCLRNLYSKLLCVPVYQLIQNANIILNTYYGKCQAETISVLLLYSEHLEQQYFPFRIFPIQVVHTYISWDSVSSGQTRHQVYAIRTCREI